MTYPFGLAFVILIILLALGLLIYTIIWSQKQRKNKK
jgi:preprotein translocase subunit YajC